MDDNIKQYYPEGVTQSEADELFKKEWTRDFAYRVKLQEEGMESIAGYGTTKHSFRIIVEELPKLFKELEIKSEQILELLKEKIESVSLTNIKDDLVRFIKDDNVLSLWSVSYFFDLIGKMKFNNDPQ